MTGAEAEVLRRITTGLVALSNIMTELSALGAMIQQARAEGRELSQEELDKLDADLAQAKARAEKAGGSLPAG